MKKYSKERALAQISAPSLKSAKLPAGTVITIGEIREQELENGTINDMMFCTTEKGPLIVPVREFLKMENAGEGDLVAYEGMNAIFPDSFTIASSEDRTDRDGDTVYPIFAYNDARKQLDAGGIDWASLKASGLVEGHKFDPVQNYKVNL